MRPIDYREQWEALTSNIVAQHRKLFAFLKPGTYAPFEHCFWSLFGHVSTAVESYYGGSRDSS